MVAVLIFALSSILGNVYTGLGPTYNLLEKAGVNSLLWTDTNSGLRQESNKPNSPMGTSSEVMSLMLDAPESTV